MNVTAFSNKNFTVDVQQLILPERRHHVHPVAFTGVVSKSKVFVLSADDRVNSYISNK